MTGINYLCLEHICAPLVYSGFCTIVEKFLVFQMPFTKQSSVIKPDNRK